MSTADPATSATSTGDHGLVHHFIRAHGRRPTGPELDELRGRRAVVRRTVVRGGRHAAATPSLASALRREVARLVARL